MIKTGLRGRPRKTYNTVPAGNIVTCLSEILEERRRYLKSTVNFGITYRPEDILISGYVNADGGTHWTTDVHTAVDLSQ